MHLPKLSLGMKIALAIAGTVAVGGVIVATRKKKPEAIAADFLATASNEKIAYLSTIKGRIEAQATVTKLLAMSNAMDDGTALFIEEKAFRTLITHGGLRVLDFLPSVFYKSTGDFTFDELTNHPHCQTIGAQVVQMGNDWATPFYHQVYRGPDIVQNGVHYAGNPIDAQSGEYTLAASRAMEAAIQNAESNGDLVGALSKMKAMGIPIPGLSDLPADMPPMFLMNVPKFSQTVLAKFARDMAAKASKSLPTTTGDGKPLTEDAMRTLHASVGAAIVAGFVDRLESHSEKENPCIKVVDAGLVVELFMATVGTVLTLAIGPALSGISTIIKVVSTINKLAELGS